MLLLITNCTSQYDASSPPKHLFSSPCLGSNVSIKGSCVLLFFVDGCFALPSSRINVSIWQLFVMSFRIGSSSKFSKQTLKKSPRIVEGNSGVSSQNFQQTLHALTFESQWDYLRSILDAAFSSRRSRIDGMSLYWCVYALCITKPSPFDTQLYAALEGLLTQKALQTKQTIVESGNLLEAYYAAWKNYNVFSKIVTCTFGYLDRVIANSNQKTECLLKRPSISQLIMNVWNEHVIRCIKTTHGNLLVTAFISLINDERSSVTNRNDIEKCGRDKFCKAFVDSFIECRPKGDLFLYKEELQEIYLQECLSFYTHWMQDRTVCVLSLSQYLHRCATVLLLEHKLIKSYMHISSYNDIFRALNDKLICKKGTEMISSFMNLLESGSKRELQLIHSLHIAASCGTEVLVGIFEQFLVKKCSIATQAIKTDNWPLNMLFDNFVLLRNDFLQLIATCFHNDALFRAALEKVFRSMLNQKIQFQNKFCIYLPVAMHKWLELLIAKPDLSDAEIDGFFNLFKYIDDKESFIQMYSYELANRLIVNPLTDGKFSADQKIVTKLKEMCGLEYTGKVLKMLNDIVNAPYNEGTVVKAKIISQNAWPKYQLHCDLDAEIGNNLSATEAGLLSVFEGNYTSRYQGRKLTWYHSLSNVTVSYGKMILVIPFVHFVTLKMFSREKLTLSDLNSQLKFPPDILQAILDDLVKYKLLSVTVVSKTIIYRLNINHNIQQTVSIPLPRFCNFGQADKPNDSSDPSPTDNSIWSTEDKRAILQSVIVRIAKKHRSITHNGLIDETIQECSRMNPNLKHSPHISLLKQTIEQLIEKQYIERDPTNNDFYHYVA